MPSPVSTPEFSATFNDRLVPLHDGRPGLRGGLPVEVCTPVSPRAGDGTSSSDPEAPILDFIASSETLDRYDEIIVASGWRLDNYRRNPVFQNAHQYGDVIFTLGKALITEVRSIPSSRAAPDQLSTINSPPSTFLYQRIQFATDVNPMARIAYGLYKGKFLNAVSVGFIPLRWENGSAEAGFRRKYLEQELLEVSAVGIPANPEALQLGLKAGAIQKADVRELLELLSAACGRRTGVSPVPSAAPLCESFDFSKGLKGQNVTKEFPAASHTHAGASGVRSNEARLLQLARALREILRRT